MTQSLFRKDALGGRKFTVNATRSASPRHLDSKKNLFRNTLSMREEHELQRVLEEDRVLDLRCKRYIYMIYITSISGGIWWGIEADEPIEGFTGGFVCGFCFGVFGPVTVPCLGIIYTAKYLSENKTK